MHRTGGFSRIAESQKKKTDMACRPLEDIKILKGRVVEPEEEQDDNDNAVAET